MTHPQPTMKSDDLRIRVAVAELCGWTFHPPRPVAEYTQAEKEDAVMCWVRFGDDGWNTRELPDYPEDLNACAEFEKGLTDKEGVLYRHFLACNSDGRKRTFNTVEAAMCHATAAQRCAAFLKVRGVKVETKEGEV